VKRQSTPDLRRDSAMMARDKAAALKSASYTAGRVERI